MLDYVTMTNNWTPEIQKADTPLYLAITKAIAEDIATGRLPQNYRMPTHRELADRMKVALGTITRAYIEAERRGLIRSEGRRGTFVGPARNGRSLLSKLTDIESRMINFSHNHPSYAEDPDLTSALKKLTRKSDIQKLLHYPPSPGYPEHREVGAQWLAQLGYITDAESVIITGGTQHAMVVVFGAIASRDDIVLTESYTYPGMKAAAELYGIQLIGVDIDDEGMIPERLEEICRHKSVRAVYVNPTLHNPTSITYSEKRRKEIADLAERCDFLIVEDEILRPLADDPPPFISSYVPERSFVLMSASKTITAGLRAGFITAPSKYRQRVIDSLQTSILSISPLCAEILCQWITDGTATRVIARRKAELVRRQKAATKIIGKYDIMTAPSSQHIWLKLPETWSGNQFTIESYRRDIALTPSELFAVNRDAPANAVRISIAAVPSIDTMQKGLEIIASVLEGTPLQDSATV